MKKALVVDDNKIVAETLEMMLEDLGYEVRVAYNPDQVKPGEDNYDLIFCDMMMPTELSDTDEEIDEEFGGGESVMVGVHAINRFSKEFPGASLIAMSGMVESGVLSALSKFGANVSLMKPFGIDELENAISRATSCREQSSA